MNFIGIDINRIQFSWVSAAEGAKWADVVNNTVTKIRELGPYTEYQKVANYLAKEVKHG
jgi:coenzyme F420-reducing hydrogenase delta subunit